MERTSQTMGDAAATSAGGQHSHAGFAEASTKQNAGEVTLRTILQGSTVPEMEYSRKKVLGKDAVAYADWPELIVRMLTCCPESHGKRGGQQRAQLAQVRRRAPGESEGANDAGARGAREEDTAHGEAGAAARRWTQAAGRPRAASPLRLAAGGDALETLRSSTSRQKSWPTRASALNRWCQIFASSPVAWRRALASASRARATFLGASNLPTAAEERGNGRSEARHTCAAQHTDLRSEHIGRAAGARPHPALPPLLCLCATPPRAPAAPVHPGFLVFDAIGCMAGTRSADAFLAQSVATLTRPFACDAARLDGLSPADRAAVGAICRARPPAPPPSMS